MAKARKGSARSTTGSSIPADVLDAVGSLVATAQTKSAPLTKKAGREIRKLGKQLDSARAKESKRLGQLARAESTKGRKQVDKRRRQAGEAAADVAGIIGRIGDRARSALGTAVDVGGATMRNVGSAAADAARAISPVKASPVRTRGRSNGSASTPTTRTRTSAKPAATRKPAAATPTSTTAASAATGDRNLPKPATKPRPATSRTTATTRKRATPRTRRSLRPATEPDADPGT